MTDRDSSPPTPILNRFLARVDQSGDCWEWQGTKLAKGYGRFALNRRTMVMAHRFAYEQLVGPIPAGLVIDHLCRNPGCVNPAHLEPITNQENILRGDSFSALNARKTHCKRGHLFDRIDRDGHRQCQTCRNLRQRKTRRVGD